MTFCVVGTQGNPVLALVFRDEESAREAGLRFLGDGEGDWWMVALLDDDDDDDDEGAQAIEVAHPKRGGR